MVKVPFFRSPYNYDMDVASLESGLECKDDSLAVQAAAEECDINTIVRRFGLTGELPDDLKMPQSGDFTNLPDFHAAMNMVRYAEEEFLRVPAALRARFGNDPNQLMAFIDDEANRDEAMKLGLLKEVVPPVVPSVVPVVS